MYHMVIDRGAEAPREAIISEEGRSSTVVTDELLSTSIQLQSRDSRSYDLSDLCKRTSYQKIGRTHQFDLFVCLQVDHLSKQLLSLYVP